MIQFYQAAMRDYAKAAQKIAAVCQSAALYPWITAKQRDLPRNELVGEDRGTGQKHRQTKQ
jgi:hypothetical protein